MDDLTRLLRRAEELVDTSGVVPLIEEWMPHGGRPRQLSVSTLLVGVVLNPRLRKGQLLTEVLRTLLSLRVADRRRLGVDVNRGDRVHQLTYRQLTYAYEVVTSVIEAHGLRPRVNDLLIEATIPDEFRGAADLAVDWTDVESWARKSFSGRPSADPDAQVLRRSSDQPATKNEYYFGYTETIAVLVPGEGGRAVPGLIRRSDMTVVGEEPAWKAVEILRRIHAEGLPAGDLLADAGYSTKVGLTRAVVELGFAPIIDLHPEDTGQKGSHEGAVISNGCLYCPKTPEHLLQITKPKNGASTAEIERHSTMIEERDAYRLPVHAGRDEDGYMRVMCPAWAGKVTCTTSGVRPREVV